jgi:hypothetical protein
MIKIEQPEIINNERESILQTYLTIDTRREPVWFKVDKKYGRYLCYERGDAFLIGILNYAMRNKHDIVSEAPISEDLYYNIETYLVNAVASYNNLFYRTSITAPVASSPLPCAGAVGTGISCGVDSLHSLICQTNLKFTKHNITHLAFNNVGSHGEGEKAEELYRQRLNPVKEFAKEYNFELVSGDSNIMNVIEQEHFKSHTYSSIFCVYCLQKLYSVYYYASAGYQYHEFSLVELPESSPGRYEMLLLPLLSTHSLRIYSEGEGLTRLQKLNSVVTYEPSYKYLNVCLKTVNNCNRCEKCVRTILGIDALGSLEKYKNVFDIDYYYKNQKWYLQQMLYQMARKKHDYYEIYPFFLNKITIIMRLKAFVFKLIKLMIFGNIKKSSVYQTIRNRYIKL